MLYFLIVGLVVVAFLCIVEVIIYWNRSRKERKALNKKLIAADNRRKLLESERKQLNIALEIKAAELSDLQEQIRGHILEKEEVRNRSEEAVSDASGLIQGLKNLLESREADIDLIRTEAAALNEKYAAAIAGLEALKNADAERVRQLTELTETLAQCKERIQNLDTLVKSKDAELAQMKGETAGLKEKYASALSSLEQQAEAKRSEQARIIDTQTKEIEDLNNIIKQTKSAGVFEEEASGQGEAAEATELQQPWPDAENVPVHADSREQQAGLEEDGEEGAHVAEVAAEGGPEKEETAGRIRCKICGCIEDNAEACVKHFITCHEADADQYFPHLDYTELLDIYTDLPREIYKCPNCNYFVSALEAPNSRTSAIEKHIEYDCPRRSMNIRFTIETDPDKISACYASKNRERHRKCRLCDTRFKDINKHQMVAHLAAKHAVLFYALCDGMKDGASSEGTAREVGEGDTSGTLWDGHQRRVIESAADRRLVVHAGPGTGKTAVACERVAWLVNQAGIEPGQIWLISFTRTAVREIRDRIATCLGNAEIAHAVKIATIDSHAWSIHSGFDEAARLRGYEDNIEQMTDLVRAHEGVAEYLDQVEHLIVDEAQDVVGSRAKLIIEIIRKLNPSCGVTVFTDEAQAIYGFTREEDTEQHGGGANSLCGALLHRDVFGFAEAELGAIYRTKAPGLLKIFTQTRRKVLGGGGGDGRVHLEGVKKEIADYADGHVGSDGLPWDDLAAHDNMFVLFRRRSDVLLASDRMGCRQHRIRMSGYPACVLPWVGACLAEHTDQQLTKEAFENLWRRNVHSTPALGTDMNAAWRMLVRVAGVTDTVIEMPRLRQRLGRGKPPLEFCSAEYGAAGPIFGTIHASKGREADAVYLMMPVFEGRNSDHAEEARVIFVGATRARNKLTVGTGYADFSRKIWRTGRAFSIRQRRNSPTAAVEIGRDGDIDAESLAGVTYFPLADDVRKSQARLLQMPGRIVEAYADSANYNGNSSYRLKEVHEDTVLAVFSPAVRHDLGQVLKSMRRPRGASRKPPRELPHLRILGVRTVVVTPEALTEKKLHEPWASSGIMLAPVVLGYSPVIYPC